MPSLDRRLQLLATIPFADLSRSLIEAIRHADPAEVPTLLRNAVHVPSRDLHAYIVRNWYRYDEEARAVVRAAPSSFDVGIRRAVEDRDPQATEQAIDVVKCRGGTSCIDLLVDCCVDTRPSIADRASSVLLEIAEAHRRLTIGNDQDVIVRTRIDRAIARLLESSAGRLRESAALAAAIFLPITGKETGRVLEGMERGGGAAMVMRRAIARSSRPGLEGMLLRWLGMPVLNAGVLRRLESARPRESWEELLIHGHLLRSPSRRRALRRLARPIRILPPLSTVASLSPASQRGFVELVAALDLSETARIQRLIDALSLADQAARLTAIRYLRARPASSAHCAAVMYGEDPVATHRHIVAIDSWRRREQAHDSTLANKQVEGPDVLHDPFARWRIAVSSVDGFAANCTRLRVDERRTAALVHIRRRESDMIEYCRRVLQNGSSRDRMWVIDLLDRVGRAGMAELELLMLAAGTDARVASFAVSALGELESHAAREALHAALRHPHSRVRANAVEALARRTDATSMAMIEPLTCSRNPRVRANAIRSLIRFTAGGDEAITRLRSMLMDPDPRHRCSALWAASRVDLPAITQELNELAARGKVDANRSSLVRTLRRKGVRIESTQQLTETHL